VQINFGELLLLPLVLWKEFIVSSEEKQVQRAGDEDVGMYGRRSGEDLMLELAKQK